MSSSSASKVLTGRLGLSAALATLALAAFPQAALANCGPAEETLTSVVCETQSLSSAWAEIDAHLTKLGAEKPGLAAPLAEDQTRFEALLAKTLEDLKVEHAAAEVPEILLTGLQDRLSFLTSIEPNREEPMTGLWGNAAGSLLISAESDGKARVQLSVMEPIMGLRTCSIEGTGALSGTFLTVAAPADSQGELSLMKSPDAPTLGADFTQAGRPATGPIACSESPAITGWYFPINKAQ